MLKKCNIDLQGRCISLLLMSTTQLTHYHKASSTPTWVQRACLVWPTSAWWTRSLSSSGFRKTWPLSEGIPRGSQSSAIREEPQYVFRGSSEFQLPCSEFCVKSRGDGKLLLNYYLEKEMMSWSSLKCDPMNISRSDWRRRSKPPHAVSSCRTWWVKDLARAHPIRTMQWNVSK